MDSIHYYVIWVVNQLTCYIITIFLYGGVPPLSPRLPAFQARLFHLAEWLNYIKLKINKIIHLLNMISWFTFTYDFNIFFIISHEFGIWLFFICLKKNAFATGNNINELKCQALSRMGIFLICFREIKCSTIFLIFSFFSSLSSISMPFNIKNKNCNLSHLKDFLIFTSINSQMYLIKFLSVTSLKIWIIYFAFIIIFSLISNNFNFKFVSSSSFTKSKIVVAIIHYHYILFCMGYHNAVFYYDFLTSIPVLVLIVISFSYIRKQW